MSSFSLSELHIDIVTVDQCIPPPRLVKSPSDDLGGPFVLLICRRVGALWDQQTALLAVSNTSKLVLGLVSLRCYLAFVVITAKNPIRRLCTLYGSRQYYERIYR